MTDKQAKDMSAAIDSGRYDNDKNLWFFYEAKFEVTNNVTFKMPTTGATGVWKFIFYGFGTMAILGTGLIICDLKNKKTRKLKKKKNNIKKYRVCAFAYTLYFLGIIDYA